MGHVLPQMRDGDVRVLVRQEAEPAAGLPGGWDGVLPYPRAVTWRAPFCALLLLCVLCRVVPAAAQTVESPYGANYSIVDLGAVPGLPTSYGGLTFLSGDPDTLIIGGDANSGEGDIYSVAVVRDGTGHITGFSGTATYHAEGAFNDGGLVYGPNDVLFLARYPANELGQTKPGSTMTDKIVDLGALGVAASPGGLHFVPGGFPGAGQLKMVSWPDGQWYSAGFTSDGNGTYDITSAIQEATVPGGPEGFVYVPPGSPLFTDYTTMIVSEYSANQLAAYQIDSNGDPDTLTRTPFVTGVTGAEGAAIDPLTGDFVFSTFGGSSRVIAIHGFAPTCGNGDLDPGEQCDDGDTVDGDCCSAICRFETVVCRASVGPCDAADFCFEGSCPADAKSTAVCRAAVGACDAAESCDGVSDTCPVDDLEPPGTVCRPVAGLCDIAEVCSGVEATCPADGVVAGGTECRPGAGACDVVELCTGSDPTCPADAFVAGGTECRTAGGACNPAEVCTGVGPACPVDAKSTAECRPAVDACDIAERCDGVSDACPADATIAEGAECDDGDVCTSGEVCTNGACTAEELITCDACDACDPVFGCMPAPRNDCRESIQPRKSLVMMKDKDPDRKDKLVWKWLKGEATSTADFGDPRAATEYTLCVYDDGGVDGAPRSILSATAPAGASCGNKPCWKPIKNKGFKYKDKKRTADGLQTIVLRSGANGKAGILMKGKGEYLDLPSLSDTTMPLTVQLRAGGGECWETIHRTSIKHDARQLKARAE